MQAGEDANGHPPNQEDLLLDLVRRCIAGEDPAWRALDVHCRQVLPAVIRSFRLPCGWVGEIFPDFLYYLFADECRVLRTYQPRPGSRFDSWLRVCFRHFTLGWIKKWPLPRTDQSVDPFDVLETQSTRPCVDPYVLLGFERVFSRLMDREQKLLSLHLDGLSYREIGERLTMKEGAVAVAMQRLRERLRVLLSSEVLDLGPPEASSGGRRSPRQQEQ